MTTETEKAVRREWKAEHGKRMPKGVISDADREQWKEQEESDNDN